MIVIELAPRCGHRASGAGESTSLGRVAHVWTPV